jgi:hypothetical protein
MPQVPFGTPCGGMLRILNVFLPAGFFYFFEMEFKDYAG